MRIQLIRYLPILYFIVFGLAEIQAKVIELCPDCQYSSIQSTLDSAENGDTLFIRSGLYKEHEIKVDKGVTIIGEQGAIVDGGGQHGIFIVTADHVTIEGLTIQNVQTDYLKEISGIRLRKVSDFEIRNNYFKNTFFAVYLEHSKNGCVTGNVMHGEAVEEASSGNAIHAWYCENLFIEGNEVFGHRDGIYFEFVDQSVIVDNYSHDNLRYGLHFMFSDHDVYHHNVFQDNGAGVAVMFSNYISMFRNKFIENWGLSSYGLLLKEISDGQIYQNSFVENTVGIFVEGSNRLDYHENEFRENGWAIKVSGGCLDNHIAHNNFIGNSFDMTFAGKLSTNTIEQNYWSSYRGYDLDRDEYGDVPYRPVKLFNYVVQQTPEAIILLRSLFVDIINFSENVSPIFTPKEVFDPKPRMKPAKLILYDPF